jgi:hypothetical protein
MMTMTLHSASTLLRGLALVALLFAGGAQAAGFYVGNLAPGAGNVLFRIDGQMRSDALGYLDFAATELSGSTTEPGSITFSVVSADSGTVLASEVLVFAPDPLVEPMLVFAGNGSDQPYRLHLFQHRGSETVAPKALENAVVAFHSLAPYAASRTDESQVVLECSGASAGVSSSSSAFDFTAAGYGRSNVFSISDRSDGSLCNLQLTGATIGSFEVEAAPQSARTLRFFLTGDGTKESFRVLAVIGADLVAVAGDATPAPGAVLVSGAFWYDEARPAQGITLYEIPDSNDVFGTWFTHDEAGKPIWFYFNGLVGDLPGQRDLLVNRPGRSAGAPQTRAGSARMNYLDCNHAELRVLLDPSDYRTLRIRRSREVQACDALDKR